MRYREEETRFVIILPKAIIVAFSLLPQDFTSEELNSLVSKLAGRQYKWRTIYDYLQMMMRMGLIAKTSQKKYRKLYSSFSEWCEKWLRKRFQEVERRGQEQEVAEG